MEVVDLTTETIDLTSPSSRPGGVGVTGETVQTVGSALRIP